MEACTEVQIIGNRRRGTITDGWMPVDRTASGQHTRGVLIAKGEK